MIEVIHQFLTMMRHKEPLTLRALSSRSSIEQEQRDVIARVFEHILPEQT